MQKQLSMQEHPLVQQLTIELDGHSVGRRAVVSILLAGAVLAGATGCNLPNPLNRNSSASSDASDKSKEKIADPVHLPLPEDVKTDFARATAIDTCTVKVSPTEIQNVYQRLFLTKQPEIKTVGGLDQKIQNLGKKITSERKQLGTAALPKDFDTLAADALAKHQIPLLIYQSAATDFFASLGIQTKFDWKRPDINSSTSLSTDYLLDRSATPIKETVIGTNPYIRQTIIDAMSTFAKLPTSVIKIGKVKELAFGASNKANEGGFSQAFTGLILINGAGQPGNNYLTSPQFLATVLPHEYAHHVYFQTCAAPLPIFGNRAPDPAYTSFGDNFTYGKAAQDKLNNNLALPGGFVYLGTNPGKAVVETPYGAVNADEDVATALGQGAFNTYSSGELLDPSDQDRKIIREKTALMVARTIHNKPDTLEYFGTLYDARQVSITIESNLDDLFKKLFAREGVLNSYGNLSPESLAVDPEYNTLKQKDDEYKRLRDNLQIALNNTQ